MPGSLPPSTEISKTDKHVFPPWSPTTACLACQTSSQVGMREEENFHSLIEIVFCGIIGKNVTNSHLFFLIESLIYSGIQRTKLVQSDFWDYIFCCHSRDCWSIIFFKITDRKIVSLCMYILLLLLSCVLFFCNPMDLAIRLLCPWDFTGKNTGVDCHFLRQMVFPPQESNLGLLHWQVDSLPLSHWEACMYIYKHT